MRQLSAGALSYAEVRQLASGEPWLRELEQARMEVCMLPFVDFLFI